MHGSKNNFIRRPRGKKLVVIMMISNLVGTYHTLFSQETRTWFVLCPISSSMDIEQISSRLLGVIFLALGLVKFEGTSNIESVKMNVAPTESVLQR